MTALLDRLDTLVFGEDPCDGVRCPVEVAGKGLVLVGLFAVAAAGSAGAVNYLIGGLL